MSGAGRTSHASSGNPGLVSEEVGPAVAAVVSTHHSTAEVLHGNVS
jgi:hypothetical protein